jgi:hypothetical protein
MKVRMDCYFWGLISKEDELWVGNSEEAAEAKWGWIIKSLEHQANSVDVS